MKPLQSLLKKLDVENLILQSDILASPLKYRKTYNQDIQILLFWNPNPTMNIRIFQKIPNEVDYETVGIILNFLIKSPTDLTLIDTKVIRQNPKYSEQDSESEEIITENIQLSEIERILEKGSLKVLSQLNLK